MPRAARITRAQVLALPRPQPALGVSAEWLAAAFAVALLLAGLLL